MSGYISPGVYIKETDLSTYIPALATTLVGMVGVGNKGPVNEAIYISTEDEFIKTFGEPISYTVNNGDTFGSSMHTALEYLKQGRSLWYVRVGENTVEGGQDKLAKATIQTYSSPTGWTAGTILTSRGNMGLSGYSLSTSVTTETGYIVTLNSASTNIGTGLTGTTDQIVLTDNGDETFTLTLYKDGTVTSSTFTGNFTDGYVGTWDALDDGANGVELTVNVNAVSETVIEDTDIDIDCSSALSEQFTLTVNANITYHYNISIATSDATSGTISLTGVDANNFTITFIDDNNNSWTSNNIAYSGGTQSITLGSYTFNVTPSIQTIISNTFAVGDVSTGANAITITGHEFPTGLPVQLITTGTLPTGISTSTTYYVRSLDNDTIALYTTQADAKNITSTTNIVNITDGGSGTHTITMHDDTTHEIYNLQTATTITITAETNEYGEYLNPVWDGFGDADTNVTTSFKIMFTFNKYSGVTYNLIKVVDTEYTIIESIPNLTFTDTTTMNEQINTHSNYITVNITGELLIPSGITNIYDVDAKFFSIDGNPTYRKYTPFYTGIFKDGNNGIFDYDDTTHVITDVTMESADVIGTVNELTGKRSGLEIFADVEKFDLNLICAPGLDPYITDDGTAIKHELIALAEERKDCMAVIETPTPTASEYNTPQQVVEWHNRHNFNSSYAALYYPWLQVYDSYAESYIWVSPVGSALYSMALTDYTTFTWFAPAGLTRGRIPYASDVKYSTSLGDRDLLYRSIGNTTNVINPIADFNADGIIIWGQRTTQRKPSALDRINVRRLMLYIEKSVAKMSKYLLFEPNTPKLWTRFIDTVTPYIESIQNSEGVYDFKIICDESTNTADVIDRNEIRAIIQIEPVKAGEIFVIDFQIMNTGAIANESILNL